MTFSIAGIVSSWCVIIFGHLAGNVGEIFRRSLCPLIYLFKDPGPTSMQSRTVTSIKMEEKAPLEHLNSQFGVSYVSSDKVPTEQGIYRFTHDHTHVPVGHPVRSSSLFCKSRQARDDALRGSQGAGFP